MRFATRQLADVRRECLVMENEKKTLHMDELTEEEQVLVKLYRGLDRNTQLWAIYALNLGNGKMGERVEEDNNAMGDGKR